MGTGNTLDLSGFSAASNINLNAGTFNSCDGMVNNIAIAAGTVINSFVGGSGNDTVQANNNGDLITAGAGNDKLTGGTGNDGFGFGAFFTASDSVNGGAGTNDQLGSAGRLFRRPGAGVARRFRASRSRLSCRASTTASRPPTIWSARARPSPSGRCR